MKGYIKVLLTVFAILYVLSPVDLCPGPIDDLIVLLLNFVVNRINSDKTRPMISTKGDC